MVRWPDRSEFDLSGVAVIAANYNTADLVALLLWSLYRVLEAGSLKDVVVIDNGSGDGSVELLAALAEAGLCQLVANGENRHHGPALNQGLSLLARQAATSGLGPEWVWILDSDCVVARPDCLDGAVGAARLAGAPLVGEFEWDRWQGIHRFGTHCLLVDPSSTWRPPYQVFEAGGDPSFAFLSSCRAAGLGMADFPFLKDGHVIHRGRSSLARVAASGEESNPLYSWALDHHEPHFGGVVGAATRYDELLARFHAEVPRLEGARLAAVCSQSRLEVEA